MRDDVGTNDPRRATVGGVQLQGVQTTVEIVTTHDWSQVTLLTSSAGVTLASGDPKVSTAFPLPVDQPVTFLFAPGSTLRAAGPVDAVVGVAVQPLPWSIRLLTACFAWAGAGR